MTTSIEPTSVIPGDSNPIAQRLAELEALPRPAITEPCPEWCNTGPHSADDLSMWVDGTATFNHAEEFLVDEEDGTAFVAVFQAEMIHADGTTERDKAELHITGADEITDPAIAFGTAMAIMQAAWLLKTVNGGELTTDGE